ncbi:MAG: DUF805 domain-containing protein [Pseudomonadota bacterium]
MSFTDAIRTCLSKYIDFSGRATRPEYWWFYLFTALLTVAAQVIDGTLFGFDTSDAGRHPVTVLVSLALFLPMLAAGWRRMQDTGRPGWYVILPAVAAFLTMFGLMIGVIGFSALDAAGLPEGTLRSLAGVFGAVGLLVAIGAIIALSILKIIWLVSPSEPGANPYGPNPSEVTP